MDTNLVIEVSKEAIYVLVMISLPILLVALVVGILISLLQALTQIQESTLTFVPKIIAVYVSLIFILPYMHRKLGTFTDHLIQHIIS